MKTEHFINKDKVVQIVFHESSNEVRVYFVDGNHIVLTYEDARTARDKARLFANKLRLLQIHKDYIMHV